MSIDLEDRIRHSLALHAQRAGVMPSPLLTERSMQQADRLRRTRRLQVAAGVAVIAAGVAAVPFLAQQQRADGDLPGRSPIPTSTDPAAPSGTAIAMARATGALLASGMTILDGDTSITVEPYAPPPTGWVYSITRLSRAGKGYWVEYGPVEAPGETAQDPPPQKLVFVTAKTADGRAVPVAEPDPSSNLVVWPGETEIALGESGTWNVPHRLDLADPTGGFGSKQWPQPVSPLGFGPQSVWFAAAVDPGGPPYVWNLETDSVTQLAVPQTAVALAQQGTRMILSDFGSGCASAMDVTDVKHPHQLWRDCSNISTARFSPDGSQLLTVVGGTGGESDTAQLRDPATGDLLAETALPPNTWEVEWTADGRHISLSGCCTGDGGSVLASLAVEDTAASGNGLALVLTSFPMTDAEEAPTVLGVEPAESP